MRTLPLRITAAMVITAATLAAGLLTATGTAQAYVPGPPCYGSSCVGQDPYITNRQGQNCVNGTDSGDNAYPVVTYDLPGYGSSGAVTLRYSPFCGANWARFDGSIGLDYWVETADGRTAGGYGLNLPNWTTMVDGTQLARVCVYSGFDDTEGCSGWY